MSPRTDTSSCPRCGAALASIRGLCATCVARGALDPDTGWLGAALSAVPGSDDAQPEIDGWHLTGTLGAGGMGRVYQAESERDGTLAAVKVLDRRWSEDPAMAERFRKEARLLRQLDHPGILRFIETATTRDGRLCIVTELVAGCDLGRLLCAEKLPGDRAMEIFDKVCAAVSYAHGQGFIHRDIKPSNILIGRDGAVKLADFGLAREADDLAGGASMIGGLTATTDQFGTAYYLAPERMRGRVAVGPEADVYSLGVLLYHVLTGQMPLGKYVPMSQLAALPTELDAIVARALEADPRRRTASVERLQREVASLWRDHTAGTLRARKWKRAAAMAAAVAILLAAAAGGAWWQHERMKPQPIIYPDPAAASELRPWENGLGMKFVPVPGTAVLFSIFETRRRDVELSIKETTERLDLPWLADDSTLRRERIRNSVMNFRSDDGEWSNITYADPGWPITPEHPAICYSAHDAQRFCLWLTWREQRDGRLKSGQRYRLPTSAEWLAARGGSEAPVRLGNVAGPEAREGIWPAGFSTSDRRDAYPRTAPVGSFPVESHGLYDLSGNVAEWVCDEPSVELIPAVASRAYVHLRGPSFADGLSEQLHSDFARRSRPMMRAPHSGFRVVLEYRAAE